MFDETIAKLSGEIEQGALDEKRKGELLGLLAQLRAEVQGMPRAELEAAKSVSGFAVLSAHEATRKQTRAGLLDASLRGLTASARDLEATHPRVAEVANRLCALLSNMGI